jgi:hypothetical protein
MTADKHNTRGVILQRAFGAVVPPDRITQEAFDRDDGHLRRLVRLRAGQQAEARDLWAYTQDLLYTEIHGPLFAYLLPFCLEAWREDLRGIHGGYGGFVEYFYPVLADRHVFDVHLTPKQKTAVSEFMRETIFEEIDDQRGIAYQGMKARPYRWIRAFTSYGVLLPDVDRLWTAWWSLDTLGRAIAAVQYISCLMYPENENPVFSRWTPNGGGGPPRLWEFEGHLYAHRWLEPNVTFLRKALDERSVQEVLTRAVGRLVGEPEHEIATLVQSDFPLCVATLEARCAELPLFLETTQESGLLAWSM